MAVAWVRELVGGVGRVENAVCGGRVALGRRDVDFGAGPGAVRSVDAAKWYVEGQAPNGRGLDPTGADADAGPADVWIYELVFKHR